MRTIRSPSLALLEPEHGCSKLLHCKGVPSWNRYMPVTPLKSLRWNLKKALWKRESPLGKNDFQVQCVFLGYMNSASSYRRLWGEIVGLDLFCVRTGGASSWNAGSRSKWHRCCGRKIGMVEFTWQMGESTLTSRMWEWSWRWCKDLVSLSTKPGAKEHQNLRSH